MAINAPNNINDNKPVIITNREIYDMMMELKGKVTALWVTNGLTVAVLTALLVKVVTA